MSRYKDPDPLNLLDNTSTPPRYHHHHHRHHNNTNTNTTGRRESYVSNDGDIIDTTLSPIEYDSIVARSSSSPDRKKNHQQSLKENNKKKHRITNISLLSLTTASNANNNTSTISHTSSSAVKNKKQTSKKAPLKKNDAIQLSPPDLNPDDTLEGDDILDRSPIALDTTINTTTIRRSYKNNNKQQQQQQGSNGEVVHKASPVLPELPSPAPVPVPASALAAAPLSASALRASPVFQKRKKEFDLMTGEPQRTIQRTKRRTTTTIGHKDNVVSDSEFESFDELEEQEQQKAKQKEVTPVKSNTTNIEPKHIDDDDDDDDELIPHTSTVLSKPPADTNIFQSTRLSPISIPNLIKNKNRTQSPYQKQNQNQAIKVPPTISPPLKIPSQKRPVNTIPFSASSIAPKKRRQSDDEPISNKKQRQAELITQRTPPSRSNKSSPRHHHHQDRMKEITETLQKASAYLDSQKKRLQLAQAPVPGAGPGVIKVQGHGHGHGPGAGPSQGSSQSQDSLSAKLERKEATGKILNFEEEEIQGIIDDDDDDSGGNNNNSTHKKPRPRTDEEDQEEEYHLLSNWKPVKWNSLIRFLKVYQMTQNEEMLNDLSVRQRFGCDLKELKLRIMILNNLAKLKAQGPRR